ncbi:glycerol acyltransferase [Mucilaginibacter sp. 14171R-50]|uniref:lysophospholipid acyltransferase family protein n=1 Tax=Mucilaginibacter sp. 14171R-50 TaxID=2703789 RepID=UPI00138C452D|nr:lysophospholipid acyltransferase family protein [Mucilaginibacter sp. 14171R-50]QHS54440.1 glycerol acyltransferase [Mucilaginibacter sp. 14171R-50]
MLYPKKNPVAKWIFRAYVKWLVGKEFHEFIYNNAEVDKNKSVLLIANHFSFWDALLLFCLNEKLFKKNFHVMILQETAKKVSSLRYGGAFSVNKGSRDMLRSLNYASQLLSDPDNLVLMFPQGRLFSNFTSHVTFQKGIMKLIENATDHYQVIFAATFIQYLQHKKPTVTVYLKREDDNFKGKTINDLQSSYQQHYQSSKQQQTEIDIP